MHRYTLPGDSQGNPSARPATVPRQDHGIDARYGEDRFAHFWASGDDTSDHPTTNYPQSTYGVPSLDRPDRLATQGRPARRRDGRRGEHRRVKRGTGKKKWLLIPAAAIAAALTGGIALAATGVGGIHFKVASPVTVQALGVNVGKAAVGQTVTAGAKVVAANDTTLSGVALTVKGPGGIRVDFARAHDWKLGTSQKVFTGSRAFNRVGTYTYWFTYKKNGGHWISLRPRQTFTVGTPSSPVPGPTTPGATPSPSGPAEPTTGPTGTPTTGPTGAPTPSGPTAAPSPTASPTAGGSSGGSTPPSTSPSQHGCASNPGACGYPTKATAGVPAGTALTVVNGGLTVTTKGALVEGKEIHGCIDVRASNVTIRNTRIIGPCAYGVSTYSAGGTTTLDRVEINCVTGSGTGLAGPNFAAHAVYIHDCENGLEINANSSLVDSVVSAREGTSSAHGDGIQSQGGNNVVIRHNTLLEVNPVTSAIITNPTQNNGWVIEDNFMGGGAYTLYCPEQGTNFVVRDNRFVAPKSGVYGAAYGLTDACNHTGITWTGNYRDSDGSVVAP